MEKLSSGYRINRAGDDAAGLAISEKMRAQITGLQTAQKNAEDGVSLVQTAEGALTEVHSMLNRMVELATQSANGTYSDDNRAEMQKEIGALTDEIDRISSTSNFNGTKLFTGGAAGKARAAGGDIEVVDGGKNKVTNINKVTETKAKGKTANAVTQTNTHFKFEDGNVAVEVNVTDGGASAKAKADAVVKALNEHADLKDKYTFTAETDGKISFEAKAAEDVDAANIKFGEAAAAGVTTTAVAGATAGKTAKTTATVGAGGFADGDSLKVGGKTYTMKTNGADAAKGEFKDFDELVKLLDKEGIVLTSDKQLQANAKLEFKNKPAGGNGGGETTISLHVGESSSDDNTINVTIKAMSSATLGIDGMKITDVAGAKAAIDTINAAIDSVSSIRSDLGALQNRLEHTINNLGVQTENITAAESRIRDVDMAKEMMAYTKNNILVQASQAMLAQANQVPQGVLQLLQ